jgi:hypothetical protein
MVITVIKLRIIADVSYKIDLQKLKESYMDFSFYSILPAILGFFAGMIAPIVVEKWKGRKDEERKVISIEKEVTILQDSFKSLALDMEKRLSVTEERIRALEINISHNNAVLKVKLPDAPLEEGTTSTSTQI